MAEFMTTDAATGQPRPVTREDVLTSLKIQEDNTARLKSMLDVLPAETPITEKDPSTLGPEDRLSRVESICDSLMTRLEMAERRLNGEGR